MRVPPRLECRALPIRFDVVGLPARSEVHDLNARGRGFDVLVVVDAAVEELGRRRRFYVVEVVQQALRGLAANAWDVVVRLRALPAPLAVEVAGQDESDEFPKCRLRRLQHHESRV